MTAFVDEHRGRFGVEPICRTLDVSASAYYQRATGARSTRAVEDERLVGRIEELHAANYCAYGYRRLWKALKRAGEPVGRDRVKRLTLAESFVDSFKTELIADRVWRTRAQLELATVEYLGWFNDARLHQALGDLPPSEFERLSPSSNLELALK